MGSTKITVFSIYIIKNRFVSSILYFETGKANVSSIYILKYIFWCILLFLKHYFHSNFLLLDINVSYRFAKRNMCKANMTFIIHSQNLYCRCRTLEFCESRKILYFACFMTQSAIWNIILYKHFVFKDGKTNSCLS